MADSAVGIKVILQMILLCKLTHFTMIGRTLDVRARCIVIKNKGTACGIPDSFSAHFIERVYRLKVQIVDFRKIHFCRDNFACADS